jgi:glycopeptide antibiotics resistance protein
VGFGVLAFILIVVSFVVVARFVPLRLQLAVWTLIVIGGVVPWATWTDHSHWDRIEWIPLTGNVRLRDVVLNILFYVPVGYFFVTARSVSPAARRILLAALCGFVLSVVTETTQVFSHGRFPGMTDVTTNTAGALIGAMLAVRRRGRTY